MARGRKPDPAEMQAAKGNPGKRNKVELSQDTLPALQGGVPKRLSAEAKKVWQDLVPKLTHSRLFRVTDANALERYCEDVAAYWKATRELRKKGNGPVYDAPMTNGGKMKRVNPWFAIQAQLDKRLRDAEDRFGLSPRSRQELVYRLAQTPSAIPPGLFNQSGEPDGAPATPDAAPAEQPASPVGMLSRTPPAGNA